MILFLVENEYDEMENLELLFVQLILSFVECSCISISNDAIMLLRFWI